MPSSGVSGNRYSALAYNKYFLFKRREVKMSMVESHSGVEIKESFEADERER